MSAPNPFEQAFDELPNPGQVWVGTPGSHEEGVGRLALLTPDAVAAAAKEIQNGHRVTLGWEMTKLELANMNRHPCQHHIIALFNGVAFDDVYIMNPQQSSQWDGLRHFSQAVPDVDGKAQERVFYGGTKATEILDRTSTRIGMQHWAHEGITGRGVLLDYASWAEKRGISYSTFSTHQIRLSGLQEIAKECNITFKRGDILFVRIGVTHEWDNIMTDEQKRAYSLDPKPEHAGVEATTDVLRWIWDNGICAVASDAISWEVYPPQNGSLLIHEHLLAGWGMPIGELFDLEKLSRKCQELGRWTFFLASVPFNMPGGVSSPPNAVAIF